MGRPKTCNPCCGPGAPSSSSRPCLKTTCPCNSAYQYTLTIAGITAGSGSFCTALNGTHILAHVGGTFCSWRKFVTGQYLIVLSNAFAVGMPNDRVYLDLRVSGGFAQAATYEALCWDCERGAVFTQRFTSGSLCAGYPLTIPVTKV